MIENGTTAGVIVSRYDSTRLPGKALADIGGRPLIERVIRQMKQVRFLDEVILATTTKSSDDELVEIAKGLGIRVFRGSCDDVLGRVSEAVKNSGCQSVVVAYGDNPLVDPKIIEYLVSFAQRENVDYAWMPGLPLGADVGVFSATALARAEKEAKGPNEREHINAYITKHPEKFCFGRLAAPDHLHQDHLRLTIDTDVDLELIREVEDELSRRNSPLNLGEVLSLAHEMPEMFVVNADVEQNFATEDWQRMRSGN